MKLLLVYFFCNFVLTLAHTSNTCEDFQYDKVCTVTSDNLIKEFDTSDEFPSNCQAECQNLGPEFCNWFNFYKSSSCQLLKTCSAIEDEHPFYYAVTGPTSPNVGDCTIRPFTEDVLLVIGGDYYKYGVDYRPLKEVEVITDNWEIARIAVPDLPSERRDYPSAQRLGNKVIVCGGVYISSYYDDCFHLDLTTNKWSVGPSLPTDRAFASSTIFNDTMLVSGGIEDDWPSLEYVSRVDGYTDGRWSQIASWNMPAKNYGHCSVVYGKYIYMIGGRAWDARGVIRLDTETNTYSYILTLTSPYGSGYYGRCLLTTYQGDDVIMITGRQRYAVELLYLPSHRYISRASFLEVSRYGHGFEMINGYPTVFGGYDSNARDLLDSFEYFDESDKSWNLLTNITLSRPKRHFGYVKVTYNV